jgi:hypothetical protein
MEVHMSADSVSTGPSFFNIDNPSTTGAAGTQPDNSPTPDDAYRVPAMAPYDSAQASLPMAGVGLDDSLTGSQHSHYSGDGDALTGIGGDQGSTGAGEGSANHFRHPSSTA